MAKFGLVIDSKVKVGPREWLYGAFKEYLEENNLPFENLPRVKEDSEPYIGEGYTILPVIATIYPEALTQFEQLAGPTLTITADSITETYTSAPIPIDSCKNTLKNTVAGNRYIKETKDIVLTIQGTEVTVLADRGNRIILTQVYAVATDTVTTNYKFSKDALFLELSKAELGTIITALNVQTQASFDWEKDTWASIDSATTYEELALIDVGNPDPVNPFGPLTPTP